MTPDKLSYNNSGEANPSNCLGASPINVSTVDFYASIARLEKSNITSYFYDNGVQSSISRTEEYVYNDDNNQLSERITKYFEGDTQQTVKSNIYYPVDLSHPSSNTTATIRQQMVDLNIINEVLETTSFKNGVQTSRSNSTFQDFDDNSDDPVGNDIKLILPSTVEIAKGNNTPESRIEFHAYDDYGNPLEV
ncbi:MAG: hypothetical protein GYB32_13070, partial [Algicola sp.]|nr:hypothetical protein [Algicola sp.]